MIRGGVEIVEKKQQECIECDGGVAKEIDSKLCRVEFFGKWQRWVEELWEEFRGRMDGKIKVERSKEKKRKGYRGRWKW